MYNLPDK